MLDQHILEGGVGFSEAEAQVSNGNDGLWDERTGDGESQMMQKVREASQDEAEAEMIQKGFPESKDECYAYFNNDNLGVGGPVLNA